MSATSPSQSNPDEIVTSEDAVRHLWRLANFDLSQLLGWLRELANRDKVVQELLDNHLEITLLALIERQNDLASQDPIPGLPYRMKNAAAASPTSAGASPESRGKAKSMPNSRKRSRPVNAIRVEERKRARLTVEVRTGYGRDKDIESEGDDMGPASAEPGGSADGAVLEELVTTEVPVLDGSKTIVTNFYGALCAAIARGIAVQRLGDIWLRTAVMALTVVKCSPTPHEKDVPYLIATCVAWNTTHDTPAKMIPQEAVAVGVPSSELPDQLAPSVVSEQAPIPSGTLQMPAPGPSKKSSTPASSDMDISEPSTKAVRNSTPGSCTGPSSSYARRGTESGQSDPEILAGRENPVTQGTSSHLPGDAAGATLSPSKAKTSYSHECKMAARRIASDRMEKVYGNRWIQWIHSLRNLIVDSKEWPDCMGDDPYPSDHIHDKNIYCGNCAENPELEGLGWMYSKFMAIFAPRTKVYFFACRAGDCAWFVEKSVWFKQDPTGSHSVQALIREIQSTSAPMCLVCRFGLARIRQKNASASWKHKFYEWIAYREGGPDWVEVPRLNLRKAMRVLGL